MGDKCKGMSYCMPNQIRMHVFNVFRTTIFLKVIQSIFDSATCVCINPSITKSILMQGHCSLEYVVVNVGAPVCNQVKYQWRQQRAISLKDDINVGLNIAKHFIINTYTYTVLYKHQRNASRI